jgi:hypothetical protein
MKNPLSEGPSGMTVPCRQCGDPVELDAAAVALIRQLSALLVKRGQEPLKRREVAVCHSPHCADAESDAQDVRVRAEEREVEELLAQVREGVTVRIPSGWQRTRPGDYERVAEAVRARSRKGDK